MLALRTSLLAFALLVVGACVDHERFRRTVTATAAQELGCAPEGLQVEKVRTWAFRVDGCERTGWYRCHQARMAVCCRPTETEKEARAVFAPHRFPGHSNGGGQVCDP